MFSQFDEIKWLFPPEDWARVYRESAATVVVRRTSDNAQFISEHEVLLFHPMLGVDQLRAIAGAPDSRVRVIYELAGYLAYREDPSRATLLAELISSSADQLSSSDRTVLLRAIDRYNGRNVAVQRLQGQ